MLSLLRGETVGALRFWIVTTCDLTLPGCPVQQPCESVVLTGRAAAAVQLRVMLVVRC